METQYVYSEVGTEMLCFKFPTGCRVMLRMRADPRHVDAPDRLLIWCPFNPLFLKLFGVEQGWQPFLRARAQTGDFFGEIISLVESLILSAPYFRIFL